MGESHNHCRHQQLCSTSRIGSRDAGGGEIVEVQGGHIVRSIGRKDRHSKVCTAKGTRDRRVRLSAHTAIKFYDVQDRLGYDRPSKAVDWLIKNAKPAIDELGELPPWQPAVSSNSTRQVFDRSAEPVISPHSQQNLRPQGQIDTEKNPVEAAEQNVSSFGFHHLNNPGLLPSSLDSDVIADTIKSFFPMAASSSAVAASASTSTHFQHFPPDLISRTGSHNQDLRLSLQSFQDSMLLHNHHVQHHPISSCGQALFSAASPLLFDAASGWSEQQQHQEMGRFQKMIALNAAELGSGGYIFSPPSPVQLLGQNPFFSQRGPLQSSNSHSIRAGTDPSQIYGEHQLSPLHLHPLPPTNPAIGFDGGFSGFCIPARIHVEDEHDEDTSKPSSSSSAPRL